MKLASNIFLRRRLLASRSKARGFTLIEALVATLIMALSIMAMISLWNFTFNLTVKADNVGVAYAVGRHAMERVKLAGFEFADEGATTLYYDRLGGSESAARSAQHRMKAVTSINSGLGYPSYNASRAVVITITQLNTGEMLYKTGATLTKKGI